MKPHSEACERNREPILQVLRQWFTQPGIALEIGAGTGQHAVHFAAHLPHLQWQPTDREENLAGIGLWVSEAALPNLRAPLKLDVRDSEWPVETVDYVFSANTAHIMSWPEVELMFAGVARVLRTRGVFACTVRSIATGTSPASRTRRSTRRCESAIRRWACATTRR